jgi:hypothetical protein
MDFGNDLFDLLKALSKAEIKFVVCGGVACVLHGVERATYDLDISVDFDKSNLEKIINLAKEFGLSPRIPEPVEKLYEEENRNRWVAEKNALVYTFVAERSPIQLDIFLSYPLNFEELMKNSETIYLDEVNVNVSSVKDLLYAKEFIKPARDKDLIDIKELKKLNEQTN